MREAAGLHFRSGNQRVKKSVVLSDPETGKKELGIELGELSAFRKGRSSIGEKACKESPDSTSCRRVPRLFGASEDSSLKSDPCKQVSQFSSNLLSSGFPHSTGLLEKEILIS